MISPQNHSELSRLAEAHAAAYARAEPFPHILLDGFFDPEYLRGLARDFPNLLGNPDLEQFTSQKEVKSASHFERGKQLEQWRVPTLRPLKTREYSLPKPVV